MKRLLSLLLAGSLILLAGGCGNVFVHGVFNPGDSSISGFVSVVQVTVVDGSATVTFVTFLANGSASTIGFCGDQRSRFPMDQNVRASFSRGQQCSSILSIVFI